MEYTLKGLTQKLMFPIMRCNCSLHSARMKEIWQYFNEVIKYAWTLKGSPNSCINFDRPLANDHGANFFDKIVMYIH